MVARCEALKNDDYTSNWPLTLAILVGYVAMFYVLPWQPAMVKRPAAAGDPNTMFGAVFFAYCAAVCGAAVRWPERSALFYLLSRSRSAGLFAAVCAALSVFLFVSWL